MLKWRIGDVTITRIVEMETTGGTRFLLRHQAVMTR